MEEEKKIEEKKAAAEEVDKRNLGFSAEEDEKKRNLGFSAVVLGNRGAGSSGRGGKRAKRLQIFHPRPVSVISTSFWGLNR